ncbi:hypothetical protein M973_04525 [Francisella orientalis LADL 07-285A]|nr:hypothetical protein M973_04525 [Francisella orientalis LADL 07-285A]
MPKIIPSIGDLRLTLSSLPNGSISLPILSPSLTLVPSSISVLKIPGLSDIVHSVSSKIRGLTY